MPALYPSRQFLTSAFGGRFATFALLLGCVLLLGCTKPVAESPEEEVPADKPPEGQQQARVGGGSMMASPLETPRDVISHQYVILRNGGIEDLQALFVESVREEITPELIEDLRKNMKPVSLSELVHEVIPVEDAEQETFLIKRKDGTELTQVIKIDGGWQADRLWFK